MNSSPRSPGSSTVDPSIPSPLEPQPAGPGDDGSLNRIRMLVGCAIALAVCGAVGWTWYSGRADIMTRPALRSAPIPDTPALARAQLDELTVGADALQPLAPAEARAWNRALPFSSERLQPAPIFIVSADRTADYGRAVDCLAAAVYYEAGQEDVEGKLAVAQVVLNRVRHPAYPKTVCGVVFEGSQRQSGCQFTFTCDGAMARLPSPAGWAKAVAVAEAALNGMVFGRVGAATHYHANYVAPYWAPRLTKLAEVGAHIFYRFPGAWSASSALRTRYGGIEPVIAKMAGFARPADDAALVIDTTPLDGLAPVVAAGAVAGETAPAPTQSAPVLVLPQPAAAAVAATPPASTAQATPAAPTAPVVQNPLITDPARPRRNRIARPGGW